MDELKIPNHVAIIMDGNGRWATNRGLKRSEGHKEGSKTLEKVAIHAINKGVKVLSIYAFSTDNFKRTKEEVDYLMNLFILMFKTKFKVIDKENIKVIFSGRREPLSKNVLDAMDSIVKKTENNTKGILNICLNYGGQEEIIDGTKRIIDDINNGKISKDDITKDTVYVTNTNMTFEIENLTKKINIGKYIIKYIIRSKNPSIKLPPFQIILFINTFSH